MMMRLSFLLWLLLAGRSYAAVKGEKKGTVRFDRTSLLRAGLRSAHPPVEPFRQIPSTCDEMIVSTSAHVILQL